MLKEEIVKTYRESTLMSLSLGSTPEVLEFIMKDVAESEDEEDALEIAEGIKQALEIYKNAGKQYCKVKIKYIYG